eukprot:TRINITY_DN629_c0_g1_i3.p2 TRINITY_DN629_c0_g1~~TRINITY_DN629_c0_g1_i3.p2  ORF type:complete len:159 (-),score=17.83 TRINITY_DN629_c0_g1_i3:24-500(-)
MNGMFEGAAAFNQPIGAWNVSNVTSMSFMFSGAAAFNHPIGDWNVSNVTQMDDFFYGAAKFEQHLPEFDLNQLSRETWGNLISCNPAWIRSAVMKLYRIIQEQKGHISKLEARLLNALECPSSSARVLKACTGVVASDTCPCRLDSLALGHRFQLLDR